MAMQGSSSGGQGTSLEAMGVEREGEPIHSPTTSAVVQTPCQW